MKRVMKWKKMLKRNLNERAVNLKLMIMLIKKKSKMEKNVSFLLAVLLMINVEYFSNLEFKDLPISEQTMKAINELGYKTCTEI